ncbi:hypothetical protein [Streptomyces sp. AM8-1-1]|uniref:hypothetical protein n=1 Tax=Streptomyces sp. AM8-1-1 TaxID=3075825 RepID=UPI0028C44374|nr:hypothetical protein [Streptomyces sp. AM8-1-1]WNO71447.1 hypothetical protein RPQ07_07315 [Streptomyces sp. AM8-1-1]
MPSPEAALSELQDRATLWSVGEIPAADVVDAACDALVAGLDRPGLRQLAACTRAEAGYAVHDLLPVALDELGVAFHTVAGEAREEAAVRALARRMLSGQSAPWELTFRLHQLYGHELPLAKRLVELDDEYAVIENDDGEVARVTAAVVEEARRITGDPRGPIELADAQG